MTETNEVEVKARELGWQPKDEFRGDPERWVDAAAYVERGETMLPLIKASNKRLNDQVSTLTRELGDTKTRLKASEESVEALKAFNSAENRKAMQVTIAATKAALIEAKKENEPEKEVELTQQLTDQTAVLREAEASADKGVEKSGKAEGRGKEAPNQENDPAQSPEFKAWVQDNPWYGKDRKRTALMHGVAEEVRANPETANLKGREFLDYALGEVEKILPSSRASQSKVEDGGRGTGPGGGEPQGGKSFSSLPQEAKDICERQAGKLVGNSRAFKTKQEWRDHYVKVYFEEESGA